MSSSSTIDWVALASHGTAPANGCSLLGVGYEDAFETILRHFVDDRFGRGLSADKVVVGPYGSGKTYFLRHLMDLARDRGCVTAEVKLNRNIDFTKRLMLYREVAHELAVPGRDDRGVGALLREAYGRVLASTVAADARDTLVEAWIGGVAAARLRSDAFARVTATALLALLRNDDSTFAAAERWLLGDISDRELAKVLSVSTVAADGHNLWAQQMLESLFQLVRWLGFTGTVVALDEGDQGFDVDRKHRDRIQSILRSEVDALMDLEDGSALVVYALTPDIVESLDYPALQQRWLAPGGRDFFSGNWLAPIIDLTFRGDQAEHLANIARRLVEQFVRTEPLPAGETLESAAARAEALARETALSDSSSSSRRTVVKQVVAFLLGVPVAPDEQVVAEF